MTFWENFQEASVTENEESPIKRRYSITSDIFGYKICPRQYGYFKVKGYAPAYVVQLYFGIIIHEVLDRAHSHYRGLLDGQKKGTLPTDEDIERYFYEVENALKTRGIRSIGEQDKHALEILKLFNRIEGPELYPRVKETEFTLQADKGSYILRGNVDVLVEPTTHPIAPNEVEIWDYKGQRYPKREDELERYDFQMNVYAELYKLRTGFYPEKAIVYFMNELDSNATSDNRPRKAYREVPLDKEKVRDAMVDFESTITDIEKCMSNNTWLAPLPDSRDQDTCDICDFRWSCSPGKKTYTPRFP